jgi:hypothetical protein
MMGLTMTNHILIAGEDPDTGLLGLYLEKSQHNPGINSSVDGATVAHDLLEHCDATKIGSIGDELKALGAAWFIRAQFGEIRRDGTGVLYTPSQHIAYEIADMGRKVLEGGDTYGESVPKVKTCTGIEYLRDCLIETRHFLLKELDTPGNANIKQFLNDALKFMIQGWQLANKRWSACGGAVGANTVFWRIAEEVNKKIRWIDFPGQAFILNIDKTNKRVTLDECHEYPYVG